MRKINNNLLSLRFQKNQVLFSVVSVLLGGLIYLLLRPTAPKIFETLTLIVPGDWLDSLRANTLNLGLVLPDWFLYSLPNGLWAFSYTLLTTTIWAQHQSPIKYFWYTSIPVLVFGFEFLQYFGLIQGTFSIPDLVAGLSGILTAITIKLLTTKTYNNETNST